MNNVIDKVYFKYLELIKSDYNYEMQAKKMAEFVRIEINQSNKELAIKLKEHYEKNN